LHSYIPLSYRPRTHFLFCCFLLVLFVSLAAAPSRATIRAERETSRSTVWKRLYEALPSAWKTRETVIVREVSDHEMDDLTRDDSRDGFSSQSDRSASEEDEEVEGFYEYSPRRGAPMITLRSSLSSTEAEYVFTHEYAHFVWEALLSDRQRDDYFRIWNRRRHNHSLVSAYAGDSVEEGFAEAFAHRLRRPERLHKRDPLSETFLQDVAEEIGASRHREKD
jgi:hypothetical protein